MMNEVNRGGRISKERKISRRNVNKKNKKE
jgi:hypothetical protein